MLSPLIKEKLNKRYGREIRYSKDCDALSAHISETCTTGLSASTLRRLYGFVKGFREPRQYTLDIIAEYLGYASFEQLICSFEKEEESSEKILKSLKSQQIKSGHTIKITYEPRKVIEIMKAGTVFQVVASNEKRLLLNDEVKFTLLELHHPLTLTHVLRQGSSIGKVQLATVSGITSIQKV